ncbi:Uncharacterised protein [Serratia fonticola]|uniref:helix-turn-helix transcriptional regulator n=1 Tax=Serratia fonticola TaxID=47917 RepID=UPI00217BC54B|nr:hypothetical protein [Serratia fonticola]CAI1765416.1 Uncharacterised protein [Serratia fonticola]
MNTEDIGYWRTSSVCKFLEVNRRTIHRWRQGKGVDEPFPEPVQQAFREGNRWKASDVTAWAERNIKTQQKAA